MRSTLLSLALCIIWVVASYADNCDLDNFYGGAFKLGRCQSLSANYDLYWLIDTEANNLTLGINLHDTSFHNGWVGFGISGNGGMRGADIATARFEAGNYVMEDRFVPGKEGQPKIDDHQDIHLISASSTSSQTIIVYSRTVNPCDVIEDNPILENGTAVIFAYGQTFGYHGQNRGQATVWFNFEPQTMPIPPDAQSIDILTPAYTIPSKDTTYACTGFTLPTDKKYHVISWRPKITPGNEKFVHHMLLYICPKPANTTIWECGMAPTQCQTAMLAWSVGQTGNDFWGDYGLPIGLGGTVYGVLQTHYNNPEGISGVTDTSGITLTYTPTLRTYDLGSMIVSTVIHGLEIPPNEYYEQWAECPTECTQKFPQNVTMINFFPHMHTLGAKIWMQHIRGDTELPEIHRDDHYDFLRQQTYQVDVNIMPGDRLRTHCIWNSTGLTNITYGGESTSQEMCATFFLYYPAYSGFSVCSDFGAVGTANCNSSYALMPIGPYGNYTALPPVESTCPPEQSSNESSASLLSLSVGVLATFVLSFLL